MFFFVFFNSFDVLMSKIKKIEKQNIILIYFQLKNAFTKTICTTLPNTHMGLFVFTFQERF
jgi:hypothetical protein